MYGIKSIIENKQLWSIIVPIIFFLIIPDLRRKPVDFDLELNMISVCKKLTKKFDKFISPCHAFQCIIVLSTELKIF